MLAPVLLVGCMMLFELAQLGLAIHAGSVALDRVLAVWAGPPVRVPPPGILPLRLAEDMSTLLRGQLPSDAITVQVREFGNEGAPALHTRSLAVDIRQPYATPLPALLGLGEVFRYRYKRFIGHPVGGVDPSSAGELLCCAIPRTWGPAAWSAKGRAAAWVIGILIAGALAWRAGVGRLWVALLFALLTALAGAQAGAFVVVTTLAGGLLALLRLPYAWCLALGALWWWMA
ncbi:MAG: hypothetical protein WCZ88_03295 [Pigmentiphaga sp.]